MPDTSVSTRVASELVSVHESSIKRWCNAGDLDYWTTPGGHRRIPIARLVSFAQERGLEGEILEFGGSAERVWVGLETARRDSQFAILSTLFFEWINLSRVDLLESGVSFLVNQGISLGTIFDEVLGAAMSRVGVAYESKQMSVGDEHRLTNLVRDALLGLRRMLAQSVEWEEDPRPSAVVGCLRGELHEIGALMIRLLLLKAGWQVIYLGQDVPTEEFFQQSLKHDADLVCISVAPPRGNAEALDAVNLLARLYTSGKHVRLAIGGTALTSVPAATNVDPFTEVKFFTRAKPFEAWMSALSN